MSEFIYYSKGAPMKDASGNISLAQERIVRCRDCAYYDDEPDLTSSTPKCWRDPEHRGAVIWTRPDGFCAWGEKAVKDESDED